MKKTCDFNDIKNIIGAIKQTEHSWRINTPSRLKALVNVNDYSEYGLQSAGTRLNFPAKWISEALYPTEPKLTERVLRARYKAYLEKENNGLLIRDFNGKHYGVLTNKYSIFDDDEIVDIIKDNDYLMNAEEFWYDITPERCHMRFISGNKLTIPGEDSPLSMCVFIDNSMVGKSAFKIRFGIYRWACTNGMIADLKEFTIVKEKHMGKKDYSQIVAEALEDIPKYEIMLMDMVKNAMTTKSSIYSLSDEDAIAKIKDKLNVGRKESAKIIDFYKAYGGESKWDLINAITDYAHKFNVDKRVELESKALKVA